MADHAPLPAASDTIATDTNCVRCGYNLRGLQNDQACPECGASIADTLGYDLLPNCNPAWLATVRAGVWLLLLLMVGFLFMRACLLPFYLPGMQKSPPQWLYRLADVVGEIGRQLLLAQVAGAWLLASKPPHHGPIPFAALTRRLIRAVAVTCLACFCATQVLRRSYNLTWVPDVAYLVASNALIVLVFVYLKQFARRVLDVKLVAFTDAVVIATVVVQGLYGLTAYGLSGMFPGPAGPAAIVVALLQTLLALSWLLLLNQYRQHLDRSIATSSAQWRPRSATAISAATSTAAPALQ